MTGTDEGRSDRAAGCGHIGRAAEDFARRVARDAGKFAERIAEHTSGFVRDLAREQAHARRELRRSARDAEKNAAPDLHRVFEDIRGIVTEVLDGVDELVATVFRESPDRPEGTSPSEESSWVRVVYNREATCGGCGARIEPGEEGHARRTTTGTEARCAACGVPADPGEASPSAEEQASS
jgi:hypothetical protein